jgi:sirohydrochlorin cobaltochelatase
MVAEPLLGPVGETEADINEDKKVVAEAVANEGAIAAGFDSIAKMDEAGVALVLMGHGTSHEAKKTYPQMQEQMKELGYKNVFVGTVEGRPESTSLPEVKKAVEAAGYKKVVLRPLMVVAGDHANNDMAANEEGSWYYAFVHGGKYEPEDDPEHPIDIGGGFGADNVSCQIAGLGRIATVQSLYISHTGDAVEFFEKIAEIDKVTSSKVKSFKATAGKKKVTFTWKKNTTFQGYQLKYKVGKKTKTVNIKSAKTVKKVIKKLKKGQKVSGQIRGYKKIDGKTYYGTWAKSKTVKVK